MSEAMLLTGKRGQGKTLTAMSIIQDYLKRGSMVATNINLNLEYLIPPYSTQTAYRLPDLPNADDLLHLPVATKNLMDESTYGLLALDETSVFLNAQTWNEKGRKELRAFLAQSRKFGWDLLLIAQNHKQVDSQIRESLIELQGKTKRTDKIGIPFLSPLAQYFFGYRLTFPKFHIATFRYGFHDSAPKSFTKVTSGNQYYKAYDTTQVISILNEPTAPYTFLSPFHLKGRYMSKNKLYKPFIVKGFFGGVLITGLIACYYVYDLKNKPLPLAPLQQKPIETQLIAPVPLDENKLFITGTYTSDGKIYATLSDGSQQLTSGMTFEKGVSKYRIGLDWVEVKK